MPSKPLPPRPHIDVNETEFLRSFGRVKGRVLRPNQQRLMDELLPHIAIDIEQQALTREALFGETSSQLWLEIGFGGGEHLATLAKRNSNIGFIGCEPYTNGVASLLNHIEDNALNNVRIFHGDARLLLAALPSQCLDRAYILFPDPWPKARHHKKRIINAHTLDSLHRVVKPSGMLRIATDHADYAESIARILDDHSMFDIDHSCERFTEPDDWVKTRYQEKALKQGRPAQFFMTTPSP